MLKGLGIAPLPLVMARESVEQGHLQQVLAPWHPRSVPIYAIYPSKRYLTAKVRAFVELAALAFSKAISR